MRSPNMFVFTVSNAQMCKLHDVNRFPAEGAALGFSFANRLPYLIDRPSQIAKNGSLILD